MNSALPDIRSARLPDTYVAAKNALATCERIDECKEWADKAEALASYAKQAKDETMRKLADRIQARAIRRCSELLKKIPTRHGANQNISDGADIKVLTRKDAATRAGLSERQRVTAMRVGMIPRKDFEELVESDNPPTVTELADMGKRKKVAEESERPGFAKATRAIGDLRRFAEFCNENDPAFVAQGVLPHEEKTIRKCVATIDGWLDVFVTNIGER